MKLTSLVLFSSIAAFCDAATLVNLKKRNYDIHLQSDALFCSFMPPNPGDNVGATEDQGIPFCTLPALGGQPFPPGFIQSSHFYQGNGYVQVTGTIDRFAYGLSPLDGGGQYDHRDIEGVTCNGLNYFVNLIEPDVNIFCIRCCAYEADCNLGISQKGCEAVIPGDYS